MVPFLFLIMDERLSGMVRHAISKNILKGLKVGHKEMEITLFLCEVQC